MAESQLRQVYDGLRAVIVEAKGSPELQAYRKRLAILAVFKLAAEDMAQMADFSITTSGISDAASNIMAGHKILTEYWSEVNTDFYPREKAHLTLLLQFKQFDDNGDIVDWKKEVDVRASILSSAQKVADRLDMAAVLLENGKENAARRALKLLAGTTEHHLYRLLTAYSEDWLRCSLELENV